MVNFESELIPASMWIATTNSGVTLGMQTLQTFLKPHAKCVGEVPYFFSSQINTNNEVIISDNHFLLMYPVGF